MATAIALPQQANADVYRASTDAAGLCREIVMKTAKAIQGRKYVGVEGWQAIAVAHGCAASSDDVERVNDEGMSGFKALGIVRRMSDGAEIARAEGFLGDDEKMWAGRPVYARRAMVQTRAISRACRSAFAHVVVMIDAGLSTTPAEEVPDGGFEDAPRQQPRQAAPAAQQVIENAQPKRQPLRGPLKTRAEVRKAYDVLIRDIHGCGDDDMLDLVLDEHKAVVAQIRDEAPFLRDGDGMDFKGLEREIAEAREGFKQGNVQTPFSGG